MQVPVDIGDEDGQVEDKRKGRKKLIAEKDCKKYMNFMSDFNMLGMCSKKMHAHTPRLTNTHTHTHTHRLTHTHTHTRS